MTSRYYIHLSLSVVLVGILCILVHLRRNNFLSHAAQTHTTWDTHTHTILSPSLSHSFSHSHTHNTLAHTKHTTRTYSLSHAHTQVQNLELFAQKLYKEIYDKLGWEAQPGEEDLMTLLRGVVLSVLVRNRYPPALEEARKRMREAVESPDTRPIPADLASPIYEAVVISGEEADFRLIQQRYRYFLSFLFPCSCLLHPKQKKKNEFLEVLWLIFLLSK